MGRTAVLVVALAALVCVVNGQGANSFPSQHRAGSRLLAQAPSSSNVRDSTVPTAAGGQAVTNPMGRKLQGSVSGQPVGVCTNCGGRKLKEEDGKAETGKRKLQGATSGVATPTTLQSTEPNAQGRKLHAATVGVATPTTLQSTEPNAQGRRLQGSVSGQPTGVCINCGGRKLKEEDGGGEMGKRKLQGATSGVATPTTLQSTEPNAQGRKLRENCPNAYCGEGGVVRTGKRKLQGATAGVATPTVLQSTEPNAQGRKLHAATVGVATPTVLQSTEPNAQGRKLQGATAGVATPTVLQSTEPNAQGRKLQGATTGVATPTVLQSTEPNAQGRKLQGATAGVATPTVLQSTEPNAQGRRLQEFFDDGHGGGTQAGAVGTGRRLREFFDDGHGGGTQAGAVGTGRRLLRAFAEDLHDIMAGFA